MFENGVALKFTANRKPRVQGKPVSSLSATIKNRALFLLPVQSCSCVHTLDVINFLVFMSIASGQIDPNIDIIDANAGIGSILA